MKEARKKSRAARIVAAVVAVAVVASAAYVVLSRLSKKSAAAAQLTEATVTRGDIAKTIAGSGEVQPAEEYTVVPTVTGQILTDNITQGQKINQGDLLYAIDPTNAENTIKQNENALQRAQLSYEQSAQAAANLTVKSDVSGVVTKVYVHNGDQVPSGAPVMDVQNQTSLTVTLPFFADDVAKMSVGDSAQVYLISGSVAAGTVTRIYTGTQYSGTGGETRNIDITFPNTGTARSGDTATAVVSGLYGCNAPGTLAYISDKTITAKASGQVTGLSLQAGDAVKSGTTVARLQNDQTSAAVQTAELQVESARLALQNAQDALKNYNITSPISGTVIEKTAKAGDTIGNTGSASSMAVIADLSSLVLTIDVDELDILSIKAGQTADITADALPGKTFTGTVTSVGTIGNSSSGSSGSAASSGSSGSGVTTYAVEITISDYGSLLPGMNVNAGIAIDSAKSVLLIPQQAVMNGGFVFRKLSGASAPSASPSTAPQEQTDASGSPSAGAVSGSPNNEGRKKQLQASVPAGYELVRVQTGLTNSEYTEVTSGLSEGDVVAYAAPAAASSSAAGSGRTGLGVIGGGNAKAVTGAMPAGGNAGYGGGNYGGGKG
jgi:HlyD family secretion protein